MRMKSLRHGCHFQNRMGKGELMTDIGAEKKQCFDDYENGSLIMNDEKCGDCEHKYECRFMQRAMDEVVYGTD